MRNLSKTQQNLGPLTSLSWSPDGSALAFMDRGDVWLLPMSGGREPRPFVQSKFTETTPAFSQDGRWLAYASDESGRFEIYVQSISRSEKHTISSDGGTEPVWASSEGASRSKHFDHPR
jgi:Tol biopolymer transport system component